MPIQAGDEILIPFYVAGTMPVTVGWQQNLTQRTAQYFQFDVDNITQGEQSVFFIAAEYYKDTTINNKNHVTKIGQKIEGEGYKVKVDGRIQFGQKNAAGELRFVVYHDKERKPYQHRFVQTAIASAAGGKASEMAKSFGGVAVGSAAEMAEAIAKNYVGDYLHTF